MLDKLIQSLITGVIYIVFMLLLDKNTKEKFKNKQYKSIIIEFSLFTSVYFVIFALLSKIL
ncbi:hypothetical protein TKV_c19160 [Thermoanaerobacter kivui]|uniref:Uncharacterized protein n=1 Tax=Thermoanaerobacter kivui TaxID=2325 RepID=A0A097ATC6_THEKI|nr:hypothetical protein [Thermoanaerobacter kivui]AIS53063.1 hypothetical protein TKV_c19160 [Thermoanaerobacter kivui]